MEIQKIDYLVHLAKSQNIKRIVIAAAADLHVLEALKMAVEMQIVQAILVGDEAEIIKIAKSIQFDVSKLTIIDEKDVVKASQKAVSMVRNHEAEILMKGLVATSVLLKAVLDEEKGLRTGALLSHIAFFESPYYHKIFCVTDAAMNISPTLEQKISIIENAVEAYHKLGITTPKVAIVAAVEVVNPKMEATVHADLIRQMNKKQQIKNCEIDGPLALDNIVSKEAAKHKGIESNVAGNADIILVPDINVGNVFYKALNFMGGAISAAVIMGASVPIVLTSRSDSKESKLMSIVLASAMKY